MSSEESHSGTASRSPRDLLTILIHNSWQYLANGTPNLYAILSAFANHWYVFEPTGVAPFTYFQGAADTADVKGPYGVSYVASGGTMFNPMLHWRVRGQGPGFTAVSMEQPLPYVFTGAIPGLEETLGGPSAGLIDYYLSGDVILPGTIPSVPVTWPEGGASEPLTFAVGSQTARSFHDFEDSSGPWLTNFGEFEVGSPGGKSGSAYGFDWSDPLLPVSGSNAWGTDLGNFPDDGAVQAGTNSLLFGPAVDLSSSVGTVVRFRRWLSTATLDNGNEVVQTIAKVVTRGLGSGQSQTDSLTGSEPVVFTSEVSSFPTGTSSATIDGGWREVVYPAPALDGQSLAQVVFQLVTPFSPLFEPTGGWNVDDVEVFSLETPPASSEPVYFGAGVPGTNGRIPSADLAGVVPSWGSPQLRVHVKQGRPFAPFLVGRSLGTVQVPLYGGTIYVDPNPAAAFTLYGGDLDLHGQGSAVTPIPPSSSNPPPVGLVLYHQVFVIDPDAVQGWAMSDRMHYVII